MLCMADCLFLGYELWKRYAATGAHLLWRAKRSVKLKKTKSLADDSHLAEWLSEEEHNKGSKPVIVHVIYNCGKF